MLAKIYDIWFTGLIVILAGLGYLFYAILYIFRYMKFKILLLIALFFLFVSSLTVLYFFVPLKNIGDEVIVNVEKGRTLYSVATQLEKEKIIPNRRLFLLWANQTGFAKKMQVGLISFYKNEGIISAAKRLPLAKPIEKSITIPEGFNIWQTASRISNSFKNIDSIDVVRLAKDPSFIASFNLQGKTAEGYLFPNTYRFSPDVKLKTILTKMVTTFKNTYSELPKSSLSQTMSMLEVLTLASIVEKEAKVSAEQSHIAGVFHNRLKKGWPLGADPTVRYSIKKFTGSLRVSEINNPSPYNTRVHKGLPPGPICSPGKEAIAATLNPMRTKDMFFVAKWDGSGEHDFSVTNAAHVRKKLKIRKLNEKRKRSAKN